MVNRAYPWLPISLGIGFVAGLRSLTAPAAVSWAALAGWLPLEGTLLAFMRSPVTVAIFTVAAIAELVADKMPKTPNRTNPGPLAGRILLGALSAATLSAAARASLPAGALLGGIGAVLGTFGGYQARRGLVSRFGVRDLEVALFEDVVAIGLAWLLVSRQVGG